MRLGLNCRDCEVDTVLESWQGIIDSAIQNFTKQILWDRSSNGKKSVGNFKHEWLVHWQKKEADM